MKYVINDSIMAYDIKNEGLFLSVTDNPILSIDENESEILTIIESFFTPQTLDDAYKIATQKLYIDKDLFLDCFDSLKANNLLKESTPYETELSHYQLTKYKRQISALHSLKGIERSDAEKMQKQICSSTVCIIGVGGIGSYFSLAMAMIGVENLILIDFDKVELSNTSRQILYNESDVGKLKINAAQEKLVQYNRNLTVQTYNIHIKSPDDISFLKNFKIDLLVLCADTPRGEIQYIVDEVAHQNNIPWFFYGPYNHSQISVGPMIIPQKTKSYLTLFPKNTSTDTYKVKKINDHFVASICDPYNGFAAQFAAIEAFKFLSGARVPAIINKRYYIDTDEWNMECEIYE